MIDVHGVGVALWGMCVCIWSRGERVIKTWRYSLHLLLSVLEVDVFPLSLDCRLLPFFICPWAIQAFTVLVEIVGKAVGEFS